VHAGSDPSPSLAELIEFAEAGDTLAAREVAGELAYCCAEAATRNALPKPAADYLVSALHRIAGGEDAKVAFNVQDLHKAKRWTLFSRRLAVGLVKQMIAKNFTIEDAAEEAARVINDKIAKPPQRPSFPRWRAEVHSPWSQFVGKTVSAAQIKTWYYDLNGSRRRTK
jgi:hypothetical protein